MIFKEEEIIHCRICFESDYSSDNEMVNFCSCEGSIKYAHLNCIKTWISAIMKKKSLIEEKLILLKGLPCQLCKSPILFEIEKSIKCKTLDERTQNLKNKSAILGILVIYILFFSAALGYFCYELIGNSKDHEQIFSVLVFTFVILLSLVLIVLIISTIAEFCFKINF